MPSVDIGEDYRISRKEVVEMDICKGCKNLIVIKAKFKENEKLFTYNQCAYSIDALIVTECSHFKQNPVKDNRIKEDIKKALTTEGQT